MISKLLFIIRKNTQLLALSVGPGRAAEHMATWPGRGPDRLERTLPVGDCGQDQRVCQSVSLSSYWEHKQDFAHGGIR